MFLRLRDYTDTPIQTTTSIRAEWRGSRISQVAKFFALSEYIRARPCVSIV
jgi:hypothetical protein